MSNPENIPKTWPAYVAAHPEVLPDYREFAHEVTDFLDSTLPAEIPVLHGPHDIGKTRLLTPAIVEAAQQRGYEYRGSIGGGAGFMGSPTVRLDEHEWIPEKTKTYGLDADQYGNRRSLRPRGFEDHYELMVRAVRRALRPSDREGLYIIDEPVLFTHYHPELMHYMGQTAQESGVRLLSMVPLIDLQKARGDERPAIAKLEHEVLRDVANTTGLSVRPIKITEQRVTLEAIQGVLDVYNMEPDLLLLFERSVELRRLGNVGELIEALARRVDKSGSRFANDTPGDHDTLLELLDERGGWLAPKNLEDEFSTERAAEGTGLAYSAYEDMISDLMYGMGDMSDLNW